MASVSTRTTRFPNSKLPLPIKASKTKATDNKLALVVNKNRLESVSPINATFIVQKGRSHSVSTWQDCPNKLVVIPKKRHLSVREEGSVLDRRNSEKEKTDRLKPSFGPHGVNVPNVGSNETRKNSSDVLVENLPRDAKTNIDETKTNDNKVITETRWQKVKRKNSPWKSLPTGVVNIDIEDGMHEYASDIVVYLKMKEKALIVSKDFLEGKSVTQSMRSLLVDWLIQCQHHLKFTQETLYLTISILDNVLSKCDIEPSRLQLMGITALWLGSKLEEYYPAELTKLTYLTEDSYTLRQILHMELRILRLVNFQLYYPDPMVFLKRFTRATMLQDDEMFVKTCQFLLDSFIITEVYSAILPSLRVAGAVMGALHLYVDGSEGKVRWTNSLTHYSGYESQQLAPVALDMLEEVFQAATKDEYKYKAAYNKYKSHSQHKSLVLQSWLKPQVVARAMETIKSPIRK